VPRKTPHGEAPKRQKRPRTAKTDRQILEKQERQRLFCRAFEAIGTVSGAAEHVGVDRSLHYKWVQEDEDYRLAFSEAEEKSIDRLEQEARRRAMVGVDEPVFYKGAVVGHVRKHSDTLLMFLLNGRRPEVFKHRQEVTGKKAAARFRRRRWRRISASSRRRSSTR
jgi:transposase-like protein